jgi:hypothetical protein
MIHKSNPDIPKRNDGPKEKNSDSDSIKPFKDPDVGSHHTNDPTKPETEIPTQRR